MDEINNKVLVIVGMHRSGTSLLAQWMHACGLHLGHELLGKGFSNKMGHFEDRDFLELHRSILQVNNLDFDLTQDVKLEIPAYYRKKFELLLQLKNSLNKQWAWKEPRTCLFLETWASYIPKAYYLVIIRDYREVVDSLLRRDYNRFSRRRNLIIKYRELIKFHSEKEFKANHYLKVWILYNKKILAFLRSNRYSAHTLIFHQDLIKTSKQHLKIIREDWGFHIKEHPIKSIFKPELSTINSTPFKVQFKSDLIEEAEMVYKAFQELA